MTPYQKRLTGITQRMAEDMKIRNKSQATIDAYTYHVGRFAEFFGKPLKTATPEDVRRFQLHLLEERKVGWSSFNQAVCGLRFLYTHTLPKPWPVAMIPFGKRPRRLPTVLSVEEVDALLKCTPNLKHRTFLSDHHARYERLHGDDRERDAHATLENGTNVPGPSRRADARSCRHPRTGRAETTS